MLYQGFYDPWLVALSVLIAVFASYTALGIADRIAAAKRPPIRLAWLGIGALAMGCGIWAMHFIGMLAFSLPCSVRYDPLLTALSLAPAVLACAVALHSISQPTQGWTALLSGGMLLGAGIGTMHYTGMAAYRLDGLVRYDPALFILSLVVAVVLAMVALRIRFGLRTRLSPVPLALLSALVMGGAISGMHYTAMAAAYFISEGDSSIPDSALNPTFLATLVSVVTGLLIALALAATVIHRYLDMAGQMRRGEQKIRRLLETAQEGFVLVDNDDRILEVNAAFAAMLARQREPLAGTAVRDLIAEAEDRDRHDDARRGRAQGRQGRYEIGLTRGDGSLVPCLFNWTPVHDEDGALSGAFALVTDLSGSRRYEAHVRQAVAVFENTAEGIMITDPDTVILSINPAFSTITGYTEADVVGRRPGFLSSGRHDADFYRRVRAELAATGHWQGEIWNRRKNGEVFAEWLTISAVRGPGGRLQNYVGVFSDITHIKRSEAELERLAHYDPLTGLPNRTLLASHLAHALDRAVRHGERLAVLMLDLDGFKTVNDSLGHPAGDQLLRLIAERLQAALRNDDIVARLGGDEFAVVAEAPPHTEGVGILARKIIDTIGSPVDLDGHSARVSASIGIAFYPDDGATPTALLQAADTAMYAGKQAGRGTYRFHHADMAQAAQRRLALEQGLRQALERHELELWYQPQVDLASGQVKGAEALLRWHDDGRGIVLPAEFIPVAEETGLILPIGHWVLREACRQAQAWLAAGMDVGRIAVNVAGPEIERGDLVATAAAVLAETGLSASRLELEITESSLLGNTEQARTVVDKLSALGVGVAIDDFGTGFSSLAYLKYLSVNRLKIDREFVRDLPADRDDAAITRAVIALGHSLGFAVTAEGVETEAQRAFLAGEGCDAAQGYWYSRPLPANEFAAWFRTFTALPACMAATNP